MKKTRQIIEAKFGAKIEVVIIERVKRKWIAGMIVLGVLLLSLFVASLKLLMLSLSLQTPLLLTLAVVAVSSSAYPLMEYLLFLITSEFPKEYIIANQVVEVYNEREN